VHLSRNRRHVLIEPRSGQWVLLAREAYEIIVYCEGMTFEEAGQLACRVYDAAPEQVASLFELLLEKGILLPEGAGAEERLEAEPIRPEVASFALTGRCNLKCIMCFADATPACGPELSYDAVAKILTRLSAGGCTTLVATGGEPLLRGDLFEILRLARACFRRVVLQTNGTLVDPARARALAPLVDLVRVALDGSRPGIHDVLRGKGSFAKTLQGIRWLRAAGVKVLIDHTLTKLSAHDTARMSALAEALGAELSVGCYRVIGRGAQAREQLLVPYGDLCRPAAEEPPEAMLPVDQEQGAPQPGELPGRVRSRCPAITGRISISPHGKVYPCEFLRGPAFAIGNLLTAESLAAVLRPDNPVISAVLSRTVEKVPGCKECEVRYFCDGLCMAEARANSGSIWHMDPYCPVKKAQMRKLLWGEG